MKEAEFECQLCGNREIFEFEKEIPETIYRKCRKNPSGKPNNWEKVMEEEEKE